MQEIRDEIWNYIFQEYKIPKNYKNVPTKFLMGFGTLLLLTICGDLLSIAKFFSPQTFLSALLSSMTNSTALYFIKMKWKTILNSRMVMIEELVKMFVFATDDDYATEFRYQILPFWFQLNNFQEIKTINAFIMALRLYKSKEVSGLFNREFSSLEKFYTPLRISKRFILLLFLWIFSQLLVFPILFVVAVILGICYTMFPIFYLTWMYLDNEQRFNTIIHGPLRFADLKVDLLNNLTNYCLAHNDVIKEFTQHGKLTLGQLKETKEILRSTRIFPNVICDIIADFTTQDVLFEI